METREKCSPELRAVGILLRVRRAMICLWREILCLKTDVEGTLIVRGIIGGRHVGTWPLLNVRRGSVRFRRGILVL